MKHKIESLNDALISLVAMFAAAGLLTIFVACVITATDWTKAIYDWVNAI